MTAMSPSMKEWVRANFPNALDDMDSNTGPEVRAAASLWWYCGEEAASKNESLFKNGKNVDLIWKDGLRRDIEGHMTNISRIGSDDGTKDDRASHFSHDTISLGDGVHNELFNTRVTHVSNFGRGDMLDDFVLQKNTDISTTSLIYFYITPIFKRNNHRKHNSHQWFFYGICEGLGAYNTYAFLTDCGTTYEIDCLGRMMHELFFRDDLIGVTARQRVEFPNKNFHPCEDSPFYFLRGDHSKTGPNPCWRCYANYFCSPCPLQGFEFEASAITTSAMFNLIEALPVMPGPCQLLNWQKMKKFHVVEEYFNLLFIPDVTEKTLPILPHNHRYMSMTVPKRQPRATTRRADDNASDMDVDIMETGALSPRNTGAAAERVTYTEMMRVNMRLAEDRVLSFVSVFSTGYGTKWETQATFFYQPEVKWQTLLTQRRRWLNGTFASYLYFFFSQRARDRIYGGMFDGHKLGKNMRFVDTLWSLQLWQAMLVLVAPAIFASTSTLALGKCASYYPTLFQWAITEVSFGYVGADIWVMAFFVIYVVWTVMSYYAPRGVMPESLCISYAIAGFFITLPIYIAIWTNVFLSGFTSISGIAIFGVFILPVMISFLHSIKASVLFICYLPWYVAFLGFFLVFLPGYSFARLWDTTWGNRSTGIDHSLNASSEFQMKNYTVAINIGLVLINIVMTVALVNIFLIGNTAQLCTLIVLFIPLLIQLVAAAFFFLVVIPLRSLFGRPPPPPSTLPKMVTDLRSCKMYDDAVSPKVKWGSVTSIGGGM